MINPIAGRFVKTHFFDPEMGIDIELKGVIYDVNDEAGTFDLLLPTEGSPSLVVIDGISRFRIKEML
jgi:hypothetical protein